MSNGAPPPVPGNAPAKKGMSPWAWVGIGCAGIVVITVVGFMALGFFAVKKGKEMVEETTGSGSFEEFVQDMQDNPAKTAAETMIRLNPELELVSTDDDAGTITFTNTKTGEEATLNFEDIAEGRFSMTTDEGEYSIDASNTVDGGEGGVTFSGPEGETRFGASADLKDVPNWVPAYPGATDTQSTLHSTTADAVMGAFTSKSTDDAQTVFDHFKKYFQDEGYTIGSESMTKTGDGSFGNINGDLGDGRTVNVVIIENSGESQVTINYNQKKQ
ncbi:MAG: hypothetical protein GY719_29675 [bacterium]|nr:hypothetical protein [bacterium]